MLGEADRHGVDQDVAVIARVEADRAADRRHAEGIAVAADAGDDAGDEMAGPRMVGRAEAQSVEAGDRPRAHGEDVAQDAADAGRRALIGLDEGGMVVALHLEDAGVPVADVDDAGILARPLDHPGRLGRQLAQVQARGFVGAVLVPHRREDAELGEGRRAADQVQDALVFVRLQAVLRDEFGVIFGFRGGSRPFLAGYRTARNRPRGQGRTPMRRRLCPYRLGFRRPMTRPTLRARSETGLSAMTCDGRRKPF